MTKLTKQEIHAIASKLYRKLIEVTEESRERAIQNYTPSENYTAIEDLLTQRDELDRQITALKEQRREIVNKANKILYMNYSIAYLADRETIGYLCRQMIEKECLLKKIPSIDELKEDLVIASIDSDFNVEEYLKSQLEKW